MSIQLNRTTSSERLSRTSLYVAGMAAAVVSLISMGEATSDNILTLISSALVVTGFFRCWNSRMGTGKERKFNIFISTIVAVFFGLLYLAHAGSYGALMETGLFLTLFLPAILAVFSFRLKTDWSVLYVCMLALCNLMFSMTFGLKANSIVYFTAILILISFALLQQNLLSDRKKTIGSNTPIKAHVIIIMSISIIAILAGIGLRYSLYPTLRKLLWPQMLIPVVGAASRMLQATGPVPVAVNPTPPSNVEMFRVKSPEALLWRSRVFSEYTFGSWSNPESNSTDIGLGRSKALIFAVPKGILREGIEDCRRVKQEYYYTNMRSLSIIAANEPEVITLKVPDTLYISNGGLRRNNRDSKVSHTVVSCVSNATPEQLNATSNEYPQSVKDLYLSPTHGVDNEVAELAQRITADYTNVYDKVVAIQMHILNNYTYDIEAPATPPNQDAVSYFLFESQRGYCDVFSSSMVVMCRSLGIPSRWVTGFSSGEYSDLYDMYIVRGRNAHAWAEVYFPGYGWITFDATPAGNTGATESLLKKAGAFLSRLRTRLITGTPTLLIIGSVLILILYLFKVEFLSRLNFRRLFKRRSIVRRPASIENYRRMCNLFARFGHPRKPSTTPMEYQALLADEFDGRLERIHEIVGLLTDNFVLVKYADQSVPDERIRAARNALTDLKMRLSNAKKRKLISQAAGSWI